jgi:hypothetical protein
VSVAIRFLDAAAAGNEAAGSTLEVGDAQPRAFDWAVATYESTLDVAGAEAWGRPQCSPAARGTVTCTWLANDPTTSLVLVDDGGEWRVSHPLLAPPGDPPEVSSACVAGDDPVRVRAGPGTDWPYFQVLQPRTCDVTMLDNVTDGPSGPWRYVTIGGTPGWIVDRVLRPS